MLLRGFNLTKINIENTASRTEQVAPVYLGVFNAWTDGPCSAGLYTGVLVLE